jgi:HK97 gp10 family phage protein
MINTVSKLIWYGIEREKEIRKQTEKGMKKCGLAIERDAKRMCAVDTGRLRASISTTWTGYGGDRARITNPVPETQSDDPVSVPGGNDFVVRVGTNVDYAIYLEKGTFKMGGAQPFLFPAYEYNRPKLAEYIKGSKVGKMELE